jgi:ketosteroid isomerase-like protein
MKALIPLKMHAFKQMVVLLILLFSGKHSIACSFSIFKDTLMVKSELKKVNEAYGNAFAKGDSSLLINSYTSDACIMPANTPAICGKAGLLAFYKLVYKIGVRQIVFTTLGLYGLTSDYVTEQGSYDMKGVDGKSLGKGKYLVLWKQTPQGWKMYRDMFNSDAPQPVSK